MNHLGIARLAALLVAICGPFASAQSARAQAWVPLQGEGAVTLTYQNYYITGHYDRQAKPTPNGATHSKSVIAEFQYGVTDNIGLAVSLPFVASKYTGPRPSYFVGGIETFPGPLDDGTYHGAFQDVRFELRRSFVAGPIAVAPFVGAAVPTHEYATIGEAVPGRHRRELQLGANGGILLDQFVRGAYVHTRYTYTTAEREQNLPYRRSNIDLEFGASATSRLGLRGVASWQFAHDAPTLQQLAPIWTIHDRFIVPNFFHLGGGLSIDVTRSTEVHALWVATVSGRGGAHIARMLSVGATWAFGGRLNGLAGSS